MRANNAPASGKLAKGAHQDTRANYSTLPPSQKLLSRLDKVRETGPDRWLACCPAHDDKSPSLSIRETTDGTILLKCWSGCGAADIVAAIGLELRDLFPARPDNRAALKPHERWIPRDVLRCVADEALLVAIAADNIEKGYQLTIPDRQRLWLATDRLLSAAQEVGALK